MKTFPAALVLLAIAVPCAPSRAAEPGSRPSREALQKMVATRTTETRVDSVDQERLVVRRIDVVDFPVFVGVDVRGRDVDDLV